jgi:hypothetical protein
LIKKRLKNFISAAFVLITVLFACNTNTKKQTVNTVTKDTTPATLVQLSASNTMAELLCQNWEDKEDVDDGILNGSSNDLEIPFHGYSFFEDGSVVQNPGDNFKTGKWSLDEKAKHISIVFNKGTRQDLQLNAIGVKSLLLKAGKDKAVKYISDGKRQIKLSDEPYHPQNNKWRIKPAKTESDTDIKNRVIDCVHFYHTFFKNNADHEFPSISFYGIPSCFKWYSGGISIVNKEKIGQKWIDCFYNKEQAVKGQQLLENIISKKYKWNRQEPRWVRQSADVLLQIADSLR